MAEQLERKLLRLAADYGMFPPSSHVLVACSGGGDSMCLLTLLWNLRHTLGITLSAAHFNHQLRPEATEEAEFVHNWCAKLGIPCVIGSEAVAEKAAQTGRSLEDTARELRYAFLERTRHILGADRIATAHHAQDNSETLLLHLIRGSGLRGLGGIPPVRGNIVRPLLTAQRWEIHSYLTRHHIPYVEDASNQDIRYTRNFIRHEILPLLEQCNPNLNARLWESACQFRQEDAYLEDQARRLLTHLRQTPNGVTLPCAALTQEPEVLALRAVQQLAQALAPELTLSAAHRRGILALCQGNRPSGQLALPLGVTARRNYDQFELVRGERPPFVPVTLRLPFEQDVAGWHLTCERTLCPTGKFNQPRCFYLALPEDAQVLLRPRQTGDAITLPARNRKPIKKLFIDAKVPRPRRDFLPVWEWNGQVCALTEFGADQTFLPQPGQPAWRITAVPAANSIHARERKMNHEYV